MEIVADGSFDESAWVDATTIALGPDDEISLLSLPDELTIAVSANGPAARYVDLYFRLDRQTTLNLHASMQMGTRTMRGDGWTDEEPAWQWGESELWRANTVQLREGGDDAAPFAARILPMHGYEFVVSKALIGEGPWRMLVEYRDFVGVARDLQVPPTASREAVESWLWLETIDRNAVDDGADAAARSTSASCSPGSASPCERSTPASGRSASCNMISDTST